MTILKVKKRLPFAEIILLSIAALLIYSIINIINRETESLYSKTIYLIAIGMLCLWITRLFIFSVTDLLKGWFDKTALLTIDEKGITDNLGYASVGFIPWSDITDVSIKQLYGKYLLVISVKNPQAVVARQSWFTKRPLEILLKRLGSPVVVSKRKINLSVEDLKIIIQDQRNKNEQR